MPLPKLLLSVPQDGFALQEADEAVLRAKTSSGESRQRLDQIGAPLTAQIQLFLSEAGYQYWRVFWRSQISQGALPFLLDLVIENSAIEECQVKVIPGSYQTTIQGTTHLVAFQIEIKRPATPSAEFDTAILDLWGAYLGYEAMILDALARLVTVDLPASLG
jgi:hypothetical protein